MAECCKISQRWLHDEYACELWQNKLNQVKKHWVGIKAARLVCVLDEWTPKTLHFSRHEWKILLDLHYCSEHLNQYSKLSSKCMQRNCARYSTSSCDVTAKLARTRSKNTGHYVKKMIWSALAQCQTKTDLIRFVFLLPRIEFMQYCRLDHFSGCTVKKKSTPYRMCPSKADDIMMQ